MARLVAHGEQFVAEHQQGEQLHEVVLFTSSYCMGGMEAHLIDLARGLTQRGWHVALICSTLPDIEPLRQDMTRIGATLHAVPLAPSRFHLIGRAWRLASILRSYPGCVVHLHLQGESGGTLIALAAKLAGVAAVVRTLHNPPVPPISRHHRLLVHVSDTLLDRVICVSPETQRAHVRDLKRDARKFVTIPNGVDVDRFSPMISADEIRHELGIRPDDRLIGTVARLQEERKGISDFIEMAAVVSRGWPKARFMVVGDGPLRPALEQQAASLGLADRFLFTGHRQDVPRLLAAMELTVFPSSLEAAQYVMLEAMAMARPVVVTPAGIAVDLIKHGVTGMLAPFHDPTALSNAVNQLLADREMARLIGEAGRGVIVRGYSTEVMIDAVASLYQELIDGGVPLINGSPTTFDLGRSTPDRYS